MQTAVINRAFKRMDSGVLVVRDKHPYFSEVLEHVKSKHMSDWQEGAPYTRLVHTLTTDTDIHMACHDLNNPDCIGSALNDGVDIHP